MNWKTEAKRMVSRTVPILGKDQGLLKKHKLKNAECRENPEFQPWRRVDKSQVKPEILDAEASDNMFMGSRPRTLVQSRLIFLGTRYRAVSWINYPWVHERNRSTELDKWDESVRDTITRSVQIILLTTLNLLSFLHSLETTYLFPVDKPPDTLISSFLLLSKQNA